MYRCILYREVQKKIAQSFMHRHFATVCSRIMQFSPKCSENITVHQLMQNFYQLVKYYWINSRIWIHVISNVTLHVSMTPLTVEDWLLIKTLQNCWKMIVEFPVRQCKSHMLFDHLRIIESTVLAKRLSGSINIIWSERIQISSWLIT